MRIVVNDIAASTGGALSILTDFYNYIKDNDRENEWIFLLSDKYIDDSSNIKIILLPEIKKSKLKKLQFDFFTGKKYIKNLRPDVIISLQNIIVFGSKIRQLVYVHQSIPFQDTKKFSFIKKNERILAVYQYIIGEIIYLSIKKADKVIVQSDWMVKAVSDKVKISPRKIIKIEPGLEKFDKFIDAHKYNNHLFIYPTSKMIYKNNNCIYEACNILNKKGITDFEVKLTITNSDSEVSGNIKFIGNIPRDKLIELYNSSTLIFPSYIETFGYPLVEARAMSAIAVASDCAFSRELLDGYENAYFFDYQSPRQLALIMEQIISNKIKRKLGFYKKRNGHKGWKDLLDVISGTNI